MLGRGVVGAVVEHVESAPRDACAERSGVRRAVEKTRKKLHSIKVKDDLHSFQLPCIKKNYNNNDNKIKK